MGYAHPPAAGLRPAAGLFRGRGQRPRPLNAAAPPGPLEFPPAKRTTRRPPAPAPAQRTEPAAPDERRAGIIR